MNSKEINETNSNEQQELAAEHEAAEKPEPKPLKKLVRVNKNTGAQGEVYHGLHEAPPKDNGRDEVETDGSSYRGRYEAEPPKQEKKQVSWVDVLVKTLTITVSLAAIIILILTLPIVNYKQKDGSSKRVSVIYFVRNYKWLGHIEGELNKDNVDTQVDPDIDFGNLDDGLDLPQLIEGQYSVLFLGFDEDVMLTDVIWVFEFDILAAKLNILQIPRDTCLPDYTNSETGKFNSIYHEGVNQKKSKIQRVVDAVQENFGIPIDAYVTTACFDIVEMVDIVGGIPMHLDNQIIYEAGKVIPAGDVVLTGEQAEWFVRFRHEWLQGDVGRIQNQRRFMAAAMRKLINIAGGEDGHGHFYKYLSEIYKKELIATDMSINDLTKLADFAGTLSMENVRVCMVPGEESPKDMRYNKYNREPRYDVYSVHKQATIDMLNKYFRPYQRMMTSADTSLVEYITNYNHTIFDENDKTFDELENSTEPQRDPAAAPAWKG